MSPSRHPTARDGFSLMEMLVVLLVIGILGAATAPRFHRYVERQRAEAAARRVRADLELARQTARTTSSSRSVVFDLATGRYLLPGVPHLDHPEKDYEVRLSPWPYYASLVAVDIGGGDTLRFDGFGKPDAGGTITLKVGSTQRTVEVDPQTGKSLVP